MGTVEKSFGNRMYPSNLQQCLETLGDSFKRISDDFCNATWDYFLCWPPTMAGQTIRLPCPSSAGFDPGKLASRTCGENGKWTGKYYEHGKVSDLDTGWTNYSACLIYNKDLEITTLSRVSNISDANVTGAESVSVGALPVIPEGADVLAVIFLVLSLIVLLASLVIMCCCKSLQNYRVRIFRNLFAAFLVHDCLELTVRLGRAVNSTDVINDGDICVSIGVLVTLTSAAIVSWMVIVTLYFLIIIKGIIIETRMYLVLCLLGWFVPTVLTITWLAVTVLEGSLHCIFGQLFIAQLQASFWIIEAPKLALLLLGWVFMALFAYSYRDPEQTIKHSDNKDQMLELGSLKSTSIKVASFLFVVTVAQIMYIVCIQTGFSYHLAYVAVLFLFSRGIILGMVFCLLDKKARHCWRNEAITFRGYKQEMSVY